MMMVYHSLIWTLSLCLWRVGGVEISRCCESGQTWSVVTSSCADSDTNRTHFTPKIFSLAEEAFVQETLELSGPGAVPQCDDGQVPGSLEIRQGEEDWVIIAEDASLFVASDASEHKEFCVADTRDGLAAVFCVVDTKQRLGGEENAIIVSLCCPPHLLVKDGKCVFKDGYEFRPPISDNDSLSNILTVHGEPACNATVLYDEPGQFYLTSAGLHLDHHVLPPDQYCLEDVEAGDEVRMMARVCDLGDPEDRRVLEVISSKLTPALLIISEVFLLITFVLHAIVPEFRKQLFGWMKMCTVAALFVGYQMLIIVILGGEELPVLQPGLCQALGFIIQFSFLAAFCWMSSMSGEVWTTFRQLAGSGHTEFRQRTQRRRFYLFNLYSWGLPGVVSLVTLLCHVLDNENLVRPGFGEDTCFFSSYLAQIIYLHGIIALILVINLGFFLASAYSLLFGLWSSSNGADSSGRFARTRSMLVVVVELFLVMGLTWVAEVVSTVISWRRGEAYSGPEILVFDVINSLQGLLIFLVLVCKPRMRVKIRAAIVDLAKSCSRAKHQDNTMAVYTVSPKTRTSAVTHSCVQLQSQGQEAQRKEGNFIKRLAGRPWRNASVFDTLTPSWKRGSYNVSFEAGDSVAAVRTVSCDGNFGSESKC